MTTLEDAAASLRPAPRPLAIRLAEALADRAASEHATQLEQLHRKMQSTRNPA